MQQYNYIYFILYNFFCLCLPHFRNCFRGYTDVSNKQVYVLLSSWRFFSFNLCPLDFFKVFFSFGAAYWSHLICFIFLSIYDFRNGMSK